MENIWGKLKEPQKLDLYAGNSPDEDHTDITKASIRKKVWEFMERNDIANFPRPVYHRIPNFKGASAAGSQVTTLPEFQEAKNIKVNPDKPQEEVRFRALEAGKSLYVPTPRLTQGLFNRLEPEPGCTKESLRKMSSRYGIDSLSKPVPMASRLKIDLVVIGSVAVDRFGRRIGKGEGFADLEWSMAASHHSAVTNETVVVSTVHDVQVFDELPKSLFSSHDVPVDIIVTPTEVIRVSDRLPKPDHIEWNILTREKFDNIGVLKELQFKEKKAGKDVKLADGFEDIGPEKEPNESAPVINGQHINGFASDNKKMNKKEGGKYSKRNNPRKPEKHNNPKNKQNKENGIVNENTENKTQERKNKRGPNSRNQESIGIFVGRIPRTARVKELKEAIQERGLRTNNLVWKGVKGFAFLYFDKSHTKLTEEEICLKLKDLKLGETILNIEPDKRKDKGKAEENENQDNVGENGAIVENSLKNDNAESTEETSKDISSNGVGVDATEGKKTIKNSPSKKSENTPSISLQKETKNDDSNGDTTHLEQKIEKLELKDKPTNNDNNVKNGTSPVKNKENANNVLVSPKKVESSKKAEKNENESKTTKSSPKKEAPVLNEKKDKDADVDTKTKTEEKTVAEGSKSSDKEKKPTKQETDTKPTNGKTESKSTVPKKSEDPKKEATKEPSKTESKSSADGTKTNADTTIKASNATETTTKKDEKPKSASASKKEKSKTPDKEVKKEESSGGGFFKRFWK